MKKVKYNEAYGSTILTPMNITKELDLVYERAKLKKGLLYQDKLMKLSNLGYCYLLTIQGKNYQVYTREDIMGIIHRLAEAL